LGRTWKCEEPRQAASRRKRLSCTCTSCSPRHSSSTSSSSFRNSTCNAARHQLSVNYRQYKQLTKVRRRGHPCGNSAAAGTSTLDIKRSTYLLRGVCPGPVAYEAVDDDHDGLGVLLDVLRDAVRQLGVVDGHAARLVQGDQRLLQELDVLLLQRDREAVDDRAEDLQQLCYAVVPVALI
jgi:hypothetical protein